jgi:chemotaxis protein MotB
MYAISSINEGKYRVMADALSSAFGGTPRTITPVTVGQTQLQGNNFDRPSMQTAAAKVGPAPVSPVTITRVRQTLDLPTFGQSREHMSGAQNSADAQTAVRQREHQLNSLGKQIQQALSELVKQNLVTVRRGRTFLEVEIQSDILFASGSAQPSAVATATVRKLSAVLRPEPNAVRVEGYTDDRPIHTAQFESNWELSAARAASVVHVMSAEGVSPARLAVVGFGEHQPIGDNVTEAGRNANRRVLLVIMAAPDGPDAVPEGGPTVPLVPEQEPAPQVVDESNLQQPAQTVVAVPPTRPAAHVAPPRHGQPAAADGGFVQSRAASPPGAP